MKKIKTLLVAGLCIMACSLGLYAGVATVADFNSDESWDGYPGAAGGGWAGPWEPDHEGPHENELIEVRAKDPLVKDGKYLFVQAVSKAGDKTYMAAGIKRAYAKTWPTFSGTAPADPHVISFLFRPDQIQTSGRQLLLRGAEGVWNEQRKTFLSTWDINGGGDTWRLIHRGDPVDTGMKVIAGNVYKFKVTVDPAKRQYQVAIENVTASTTYSSPEPLTWISEASSTGQINIRNGGWNGFGTALRFSIGNIAIVSSKDE